MSEPLASPRGDKGLEVHEPWVTSGSAKESSATGDRSRTSAKPKKRLKWRWYWKKKDLRPPPVPQFSHNPPGHTCGLPCCNQDNEPQQTQLSSCQRGCVSVPILSQAEVSENNFFLKRKSGKWVLEKTSSQNDVDDDDLMTTLRGPYGNGNKSLNFSSCPDLTLDPDTTTKQGTELTNEKSNKIIRHRKQNVLLPWERIRERHITLPDCPETQHRMIFLHHQPGETSDFVDVAMARRVLEDPTTNIQNTKDSEGSASNNVQDKNDIPRRAGNVFAHDNLSVADSSIGCHDDVNDAGSQAYKKRRVHSKLPAVPVENRDLKWTLGQTWLVNDEEDDLSMEDKNSLFNDHVYDVLSEVKAIADVLSQDSGPADLISVSGAALTGSTSEYTPSGSVTYRASISDINTECYVYNGSLLSQGTDDTDSWFCYPTLLGRHRYLVDKSDYPPSVFREGCTDSGSPGPVTFITAGQSLVHPEQSMKWDRGSSEDDHIVDSLNKENDSRFKTYGDLGVPKVTIHKPSLEAYTCWPGLDTRVPYNLISDDRSKLKLWDLRLLTTNTEQNHYSTFPLRGWKTEEASVGPFTRTPDLGHLPRHNSDVSADHLVTWKIERLLRAPILTKYLETDNFPCLDHSPTFKNSDTISGNDKEIMNSWKHVIQDRDHEVDTSSISVPVSDQNKGWANPRPSSWAQWLEESTYGPPSYHERYNQTKQSQAASGRSDSYKSSANVSTNKHRLGLSPPLGHNLEDSMSCGESEYGSSDLYSLSSIYSLNPRSAANGSIRSGSKVSGRSVSSGSREYEYKGKSDQNNNSQNVISNRVVDWRRQSELYRDKTLITLIL